MLLVARAENSVTCVLIARRIMPSDCLSRSERTPRLPASDTSDNKIPFGPVEKVRSECDVPDPIPTPWINHGYQI